MARPACQKIRNSPWVTWFETNETNATLTAIQRKSSEWCVTYYFICFVSDAKEAENFACRAGDKEGQINCTWNPKLEDACFTYQLNLSPSDRNVNRKAWENQITIDKLTPGLTYNISILSITDNGNSTTAQTTNAIASKSSSTDFVFVATSFVRLYQSDINSSLHHIVNFINI